MYHISVLTGRQDEDDFGERLRDMARVEYCSSMNEDIMADRMKDTDVIICKSEKLTSSLIDRLDDLKLIVILSTRSENVDLEAASKKGILVVNNTSYCVDDIADHTCAMILALIRQLPEYQSDIRSNSRWEYGTISWPIHRVSDNLIGLVGFGHVGRAVAFRLQAFGCKIQAYDPFVSEKVMMEHRVRPVDFDKLLQTSDVVSLHMPLDETTKYIFQDEQFEQMKKGAIFVNCCRGGLVDEASLYHAVDDGHIRSAALDVLSMEHPSPMLLKMIARPEFLLTPNVSFHSVEADQQLHNDAEHYIRLFLSGQYQDLPVVPVREGTGKF
ncbi:C-terminal binding protein [Megasphaera cerevisiae]|uniref:C-terminal binding protein n=1 Tax=Megasphaera cerevisiae TaxID=39029 RepID=UPI0009430001|nr:C-terminal binding protein [Megasphaera cerevisiae]OKY52562.1 4-phosphoerythronate dehydrogenase [Megasphaera cerevisiae]